MSFAFHVQDVSCAAVDPVVGDVLMVVDVPGVPAVATVQLMQSLLLFMNLLLQGFSTFLASLMFSVPGIVGFSAVTNSAVVNVPALASDSCS
jgi:hypothetical protein